MKGSGTGVQGHSRFPVENARALLHVAVLQDQHGLSFDEAIKTTAAAELASPSTLRAAILEFASTGMLLHPSTAHEGKEAWSILFTAATPSSMGHRWRQK